MGRGRMDMCGCGYLVHTTYMYISIDNVLSVWEGH